ncbi:TIGR01212 family radical SAM protein [Lamprobacter modestohalophilus]|uniref:TIGR01212 family radical SAM protein n=1 Tax=Lamprobacter modestohalophilus TaxID=1064514 RepID=UPI002ADEBFE1|nr:TIGR01212 family radical SAM protein [Lamprobacter modestohalophilus]MEA1049464.1 TIGR01212 family radical SAM protein [Lamprobacter modestohalophilus]
MTLADRVNTFGVDLVRRYGRRVHKLAIHAGFTCPNRDGSKGRGGCSFCNNVSFSPNANSPNANSPTSSAAKPSTPELSVAEQIEAGRQVLRKRTGAERFFAYFQAYTNTYDDITRLSALYQQALEEPDVIGLSVGTRPDCVPDAVLDLLAGYRTEGYEIWLELGLQSAFDSTLTRVNRGHSFADYRRTVRAARLRGIPVCTHLIIGLPGEGRDAALETLNRVIALGTDGLKLHPLHVVRNTLLAHQWGRGGYQPLAMDDYIEIAADLIERTPDDVLYHRVTGTAQREILLAPEWCSKKWVVLNGIENALRRRGTCQGALASEQSSLRSSAIDRVA